MPTKINGSTGIDKIQDGVIQREDFSPSVSSVVYKEIPAFLASNSATQTVTANVYTKVTLNTIYFDTNNSFDNSRFTPKVAGYYMINANLYGTCGISLTSITTRIYKNGSSLINGLAYVNTVTTTTSALVPLSCLVYMNGTTDYIEMYGRVTGTGVATFIGSADYCTFSGYLVRGE